MGHIDPFLFQLVPFVTLCDWSVAPGIWKKPVPKDLQVGFAALLQSVRHINVSLVKCGAWKQARVARWMS